MNQKHQKYVSKRSSDCMVLPSTYAAKNLFLLLTILILSFFTSLSFGDVLILDCEHAYKAKLYEAAINLCENEKNKGDVHAELNLAKIYLSGPAKYRNTARAYNLLIDGFDKNNPNAMIELGNMYKFGIVPVKKM